MFSQTILLNICWVALWCGFAEAQPLSRDASLIGPGTLRIQAGQNYEDGGWHGVSLGHDQTGRIERVQTPLEIKPNAMIGFKGRRGWDWTMQIEAIGQWSGTHQPEWIDSLHARYTLPGEFIEVIPTPEGFWYQRIFIDSTRLAGYEGIFRCKLNHSGLHGGGRATWDTPDGPLAVSPAIAYNADAESAYSALPETVRTGGKTYLQWVFPPGSLEALASGGWTVTVDPTITIRPAGYAGGGNDGMEYSYPGYDVYNIDGYLEMYARGTPGDAIVSTLKFSGLPLHARYIMASLKWQFTQVSAGTAELCLLTAGQDTRFRHGNQGSWGEYAGEPSWSYMDTRADRWASGVGLNLARGRLWLGTPSEAAIALLPRLIERHGAAFVIKQTTSSTETWYIASSKHSIDSYRPSLTIQYTYAAPTKRFGGGFGRSFR